MGNAALDPPGHAPSEPMVNPMPAIRTLYEAARPMTRKNLNVQYHREDEDESSPRREETKRRQESKRRNAHGSPGGVTFEEPPAPPAREHPTPLPRTLVVRLVEVNRLIDIDIMSNRFTAELLVQLVFEGGAKDEHLTAPSDEFPLDDWGRPTFRPSAAWYMAQVDFNNTLSYTTLDAKIVTEGDDLVMLLRFEGNFAEEMELDNFPCDEQKLTMSLAFNVRTTGMVPLNVVVSPELKTATPKRYVDGKKWALFPMLEVDCEETGLTADRMFPAVNMAMIVGRNPTYFLWNCALPVTAFVPMACLQFCVSRDFIAERLGVSLATVLTAIAHKYSMTSMVPPVSYLTLLDIYVLSSLALIFFIVLQGGLVGSAEQIYCRTQAIFEEDFASIDNASSTGRRLVVSAGGGGSSSGTTALERMPVAYKDEVCPYSRYGELNRFDAVDYGFLILDLLLWVALQIWAIRAYRRAYHALEKRIAAHTELENSTVAPGSAQPPARATSGAPAQPAAPNARARGGENASAAATRADGKAPADATARAGGGGVGGEAEGGAPAESNALAA